MENLSQTYLGECKKSLEAEQSRSLSATNNWAHVDRNVVHKDWDDLYKRLSGCIGSVAEDNENVQSLIKEHYDIACRFYTPSKEAYIGMAVYYQENEGMKKFHNSYHPEMVDYLGNAMVYYADRHL